MTAELDLHALRREHGGVVYDGGQRWIGPGPGHSRLDASLSVRLGEDGRPLIHSFAGDDFATCAAHLGIETGRLQKPERDSYSRARQERHAEAARRENAALAFCERLWRGGKPVEGSPGERYFDARAIDWFPADVCFHPAAPRGYQCAATAPAILALARSVTGAVKAVQATFLSSDGRSKASRSKAGRVTFGAILGGAVRLSPLEPRLAVGEGLETCASFAKLQAIPTWACLGTANLEAFRPPSMVRELVIAADGDEAGMKAALALAAKLRSRCDVMVMPAPTDADWNDVATGKADV